MTKVINLWDNRYRINVYVQIEEDQLTKRKISASYFCHYNESKHELKIIPDRDKKIQAYLCRLAIDNSPEYVIIAVRSKQRLGVLE